MLAMKVTRHDSRLGLRRLTIERYRESHGEVLKRLDVVRQLGRRTECGGMGSLPVPSAVLQFCGRQYRFDSRLHLQDTVDRLALSLPRLTGGIHARLA